MSKLIEIQQEIPSPKVFTDAKTGKQYVRASVKSVGSNKGGERIMPTLFYISGLMTVAGLSLLLQNQAIIISYVLGIWTYKVYLAFINN